MENGNGSGVSVNSESDGVTGDRRDGRGEWSGRTGTEHYGGGSLGTGDGAHDSSGQMRGWEQVHTYSCTFLLIESL